MTTRQTVVAAAPMVDEIDGEFADVLAGLRRGIGVTPAAM
jgi:hypothetical protein